MVKVSPFIHFNGKCVHAMELYQKALRAKVIYKATYSDSKKPEYQIKFKENWIYHAQIKIGEIVIMVCDDNEGALGKSAESRIASEMSLCVWFDSADEAKLAYEAMREQATEIVPFSRPSQNYCFVHIADKFGVRWWILGGERC